MSVGFRPSTSPVYKMERKNSIKSVDTVINKVDIVKIKRTKSDCLVCILRPMLLVGGVIGLSPVTYECPHSDASLNTCKFRRSKYFMIVSALFCIISTCMLCFDVYYLVGDISPFSKDKIIKLSSVGLFETSTVVIYVFSVLHTKARVKEINGLVAIIANRGQYCIDTIFDKKIRRNLRRRWIVYLTITFALLFFHVSHIIYCTVKGQLRTIFAIIRGFSSCISLLAQMVFIFQYAFKAKLYQHVLDSCYNRIKEALNDKLTGSVEDERVWAERSQNVNHILHADKITRHSFEITGLLQKLQQMHCAIVLNVKQWNEYLNPLLLTAFGLSVLMLVMSYYLLISLWMLADSSHSDVIYLMEFKTLSVIAAMTYLLMVTDTLSKPEGEILPYLEGYPISKLSPSESLQAEILIMTVRMLRPQLSASGVFNISIGLIASIIGTIVTYVLVALQFHASWTDQ